ncbi:hypothetical protein AbraIFM66950_007107 [Aspergillus brasiliensis]|nr:hypothetical protein AbraIFM66950_007107 [Aspergillus brasiliensis]
MGNVNCITRDCCANDIVVITYGTAHDYEEGFSEWPSSIHIISNNQRSNCDNDKTRGVNNTQTTTAEATESIIRNQAEYIPMVLKSTAAAARKRNLTIAFSGQKM